MFSAYRGPMKHLLLGALASLMLVPSAFAKVQTQQVQYEVDGVKLTGFVAYDDAKKGSRPGVLVVHEWWGHNNYARKRATQLAEMGYVGFALDMYGDGKLASHPQDASKFMNEVIKDMPTAKKRFMAAKKLLEDHQHTDKTKTAAIGYCFGGAVVLTMARMGVDLDGVASFHGSLATPSPAKKGKVTAKVLVLHGAADPFIKPEHVTDFKKEMKDAAVDMKFIAYEGAVHAFTNPEATATGKKFKLPLAYDKKADRESWKELTAFLNKIFK